MNRISLWRADTPYPGVDTLRYPEGAEHSLVHRADAAYGFLHDAAVVAHDGVLFVAWYNCPSGEIVGESLIRGRRSRDGGRTWSAVETVAADRDGKGIHYVAVQFFSTGGRLYAYVSTMTGHDFVVTCEAFVLDGAGDASVWTPRGTIAPLFLPNATPVRTADGALLMAGRCAERVGSKPTIPAVAIGRDPVGPWEVVRLLPDGRLPDGRTLKYPETAVIVEKMRATAFVRDDAGYALVFTSGDGGRTWSPPMAQDMPLGAAKMCAGVLSTGQRYIVFNTPTGAYRDLLAIAVGAPGEDRFARVYTVRRGHAPELGCGPEWSYPCAVEHAGSLFVVYTSEKHHCAMTRIPIESIAVD